jgi:hypothetical protein
MCNLKVRTTGDLFELFGRIKEFGMKSLRRISRAVVLAQLFGAGLNHKPPISGIYPVDWSGRQRQDHPYGIPEKTFWNTDRHGG